MEVFRKGIRRSTYTFLQKCFNSLVIFSFVLQPFGATGFNIRVLAADETAVTTAVEAPAEAPTPKEEPKEEPKVEPVAPVEEPAPAVEEAAPAPAEIVAPVVEPAPAVVEPVVEPVLVEEPVITDTPETTAEISVTSPETPMDTTPVTPPADEPVALTDTTVITPLTDTITPPVDTTAPVAETVTPAEVAPEVPAPVVETWGVAVGNKATTNAPVVVGTTYVAPQNSEVTVTFTKLPTTPGTLSIEEITLTDKQVTALGALSNKAYDITSDMADGTFEYALTLPKPADEEDVQIKFAEDVAGLKNADTVASGDVTTENDSVSTSLDHFTIFVVVSPTQTGGVCVDVAESTSGDKCFNTIQEAVTAASDGDTINIAGGTYGLSSQLNITKNISIIGVGDVTLKAVNASWSTVNGAKHLLGIYAGTVANPVRISNIIIDADGKSHAVNTYNNAYGILNDVTINNGKGAALTVNGSTIIATNLNTTGNAWGAVNVDPGSGVTIPSVFTLNSGILEESTQIWSDGAHVTGSATVTVVADGYSMYKKGGTSAFFIWTNRVLTDVATITRDGVAIYYTTIQAAIDDAISSETINVAAGTYTENVTISTPLTLQGTSGANLTGSITIASDNVTVDSMDITNPALGYGIVATDYSNVTITNNTIHDIGTTLASGSAQAIYVKGYSSAISGINISNNHVSNVGNTSLVYSGSGSAKGIFIGDSNGSLDIDSVTISNNTISSIAASGDAWPAGRGAYGILVNHSTSAAATRNLIISNNTISNLDGFWAHGIGLEGNTPSATVSGNTITGLTDHKSPHDAFAIFFEDNASMTTVSVDGNTLGDTASVAVDASWAGFGENPVVSLNSTSYLYGVNAFATIQAGVDAVADGGTVNVAAGTYEGNINVNKSVTLTGDLGNTSAGPDTDAPIIDGSSTIGSAFFIADGVSNVTIQGFEMRDFINGSGAGEGNGISAWEASTSDITIQDNYFHNLGWNAVLVGNDGALGDHINWMIRNNIVADYAGYGLELTNASNSSIENNIIHASNSWTSILVVARRDESGVTIKNNIIDGAIDSGTDGRATIYILGWGNEGDALLDSVTVEGNQISTTGTKPHLRIREVNGTGSGQVTGVTAVRNILASLENLVVGQVDATRNWWGSASPDFSTIISGDVEHDPWYVNSEMTILSDAVTGGTVTAPSGDEDVTLGSDVAGDANLPDGVTDVVLDDDSGLDLSDGLVGDAVILQSGIDGAPIVLTNSDLSGVSVSIPDGTEITGPSGWDGIITPPTDVPSDGAAPSGFSVGDFVIEIGSPDGTLTFDTAVTLVLPGVTGTVGYRPSGSTVWQEITNVCTGTYANPTGAVAPGECAISNGTDTKIVTFHFTSFGELFDIQSPDNVKSLDATYKPSPKARVQLTWKVKDSDIDKVYIYRGMKKNFHVNTSSRIAKNDHNDTNYSDYKVTPGEKYYYKFVTVDEAGNRSNVKIISIALPTEGGQAVVTDEGTQALPGGTVLGVETGVETVAPSTEETTSPASQEQIAAPQTTNGDEGGQVLGEETTNSSEDSGLAYWQWLLIVFLLGGAGYYGYGVYRGMRNNRPIR
jgi:hypothetical protein